MRSRPARGGSEAGRSGPARTSGTDDLYCEKDFGGSWRKYEHAEGYRTASANSKKVVYEDMRTVLGIFAILSLLVAMTFALSGCPTETPPADAPSENEPDDVTPPADDDVEPVDEPTDETPADDDGEEATEGDDEEATDDGEEATEGDDEEADDDDDADHEGSDDDEGDSHEDEDGEEATDEHAGHDHG